MMDVKPPVGNMNSVAFTKTSRNVGVEQSVPSILYAGVREDIEQASEIEVLRDVLKRTGELLSIGDRGLKFEMIEDADIYQLQVIDMTDGRVVRKIPPDEVVKVIAHLKEQLSERVDVFA